MHAAEEFKVVQADIGARHQAARLAFAVAAAVGAVIAAACVAAEVAGMFVRIVDDGAPFFHHDLAARSGKHFVHRHHVVHDHLPLLHQHAGRMAGGGAIGPRGAGTLSDRSRGDHRGMGGRLHGMVLHRLDGLRLGRGGLFGGESDLPGRMAAGGRTSLLLSFRRGNANGQDRQCEPAGAA